MVKQVLLVIALLVLVAGGWFYFTNKIDTLDYTSYQTLRDNNLEDQTTENIFLPIEGEADPEARDGNEPDSEAENQVKENDLNHESDDLPDSENDDEQVDSLVLDLTNQRIVAYYGNFYSSRMGILGQYPKNQVIAKLQEELATWQLVDPNREHVPAIHYIASTAQANPTSDGDYSMRMPPDQILYAIKLAEEIGGIAFLDLQIGQANLLDEVKVLEPYLKLPYVHLGIDPEFAMGPGEVPGQNIGSVSATEINEVVAYVNQLVVNNNLPPKAIVVHRFTQNMITNVADINQNPQVPVIIDMDGWGSPALKVATYLNVITKDQIPWSGFKIFYQNDLRPPSTRLIEPAEILQLVPAPVYIQYQ